MFHHLIAALIPYKPKLNFYQDYIHLCKNAHILGDVKLIRRIIGFYLYALVTYSWLAFMSSRLTTYDKFLLADIVYFILPVDGFEIGIVLLDLMCIYFYRYIYLKMNIKQWRLFESLLRLENNRKNLLPNLFISKRYRGLPVHYLMRHFAWKVVNTFQVFVLIIGRLKVN